MQIPEATVTMIGAPGCGKTTYFLGMYATMSSGLQGYFLVTEDLDLDLELSENWDGMCDDGEMPAPTNGEVPRTFPLVFRNGLQTILRFSWEDYRGGAMSNRADDEVAVDATHLLERVHRSDSIYLVVNGNELLEPVTQASLQQVRRATKSRRMNAVLQDTTRRRQEEGRPVPSMVVLVTKSDLIARANPGVGKEELVERIADSARALLPSCFQEGTNTLICPVRIGEFSGDAQKQVAPEDVSPRNLHFPMIFSFLNYLDGQVESTRARLDSTRSLIAGNRGEADRMNSTFVGRMFKGGEIGRLRSAAITAEAEITTLTQDLNRSERQLTALSEDLRSALKNCDVAVFQDGVRVQ
ncbi:hypothetical protein KIH74_30260 [Kineosporia sp. J2-2]|uniref:Uncharacterized protein n=1 Tax=Kineosporia corallincola TaxID=2835133 RepID=A0ABS5TQ86_9ACTN|nr:hypothetical protein [Kineosporia corallincola]MBT0773267.1 hypothetical protein [Kineosporia corallincola]